MSTPRPFPGAVIVTDAGDSVQVWHAPTRHLMMTVAMPDVPLLADALAAAAATGGRPVFVEGYRDTFTGEPPAFTRDQAADLAGLLAAARDADPARDAGRAPRLGRVAAPRMVVGRTHAEATAAAATLGWAVT